MAGYELVRDFLSKSSPNRPGTVISPEALVIHWTANTDPGADARAHRDYFNSSGRAASAHYVVDDRVAVQCLPENEMAYHAGAEEYMPGVREQLCSYPNRCTLAIEMCVNSDGDFTRTYRNTVDLAAAILNRFSWTADALWRHYDITGKNCPVYFVEDGAAVKYGFRSAEAAWKGFKSDVSRVLNGGTEQGDQPVFPDLEGHWAREEIERAYELGLVSGRSDGTFAPEEKLTRAEGVVLLMRLYDLVQKQS